MKRWMITLVMRILMRRKVKKVKEPFSSMAECFAF